ncbi:MAG TPA: VWA domain-containing protein [Polyangia bacterium]|nr:VWA domain-containing protein [Polyangia bacterium]
MKKLALSGLTLSALSLGGCLGGTMTGDSHHAPPDLGKPQPPPVMQPTVDAGPTSGDDASCGGMEFALARVPPNVMLVLDRSGSMNESIGGGSATSKWDDLKSALTSTIGAYDSQMRFGVSLFSHPGGGSCDPGQIDVAVGAMNGANVLTQVGAASPGGNTPTAATMAAVAASGKLNDAARDNYVVLATDGQPNCADTDVTSKITALYNATPSVKTFVIGVGDGTASNPVLLDLWAVAGHTDQPGLVKYYQANSPTDLKTAFDTIAGGLVSCTFAMAQAAPDPSLLYVWSNGTAVPADATNGFTYDAGGPSVTLHGAACDALKTNPSTKVQVIYGCSTPPIS